MNPPDIKLQVSVTISAQALTLFKHLTDICEDAHAYGDWTYITNRLRSLDRALANKCNEDIRRELQELQLLTGTQNTTTDGN